MLDGLEIVRYEHLDDKYTVQCAVDGRLAIPMEIHASAREQYKNEPEWLAYLKKSAETLLEVYGDARFPIHLSPDLGQHTEARA